MNESMEAQGLENDWDTKLRARFGLDSLRPWQREAITALLSPRARVLAIAPTGGGKSLCYQFPATELAGTTVVVSPLIALMEDQVRALTDRGIPATYIASNLDAYERRERAARLRDGGYRLVYVSPERLGSASVVDGLARLRPPLVAIDEAHCIAQWGHDFRPDYLRLGAVVEALSAPRVLACTATATPGVRIEIRERLGLGGDVKEILRGFARPNLHLAAKEIEKGASRRRLVVDSLKEALGAPSQPAGAAIVYAGTRNKTETLAETVAKAGYRTAAYHAGLSADERGRVSQRFADRTLDVVVATNAFGMGIDRPDVRTVIHLSAPGSIEAYYQEVGRAGRDGKPAHGLLLTGAADIGLRRRLIELGGRNEGAPTKERVETQWNLFRDLLRYVEAGSCRHDFILRYFGDEQETLGGCGHCDVCERLEALGGEARTATDEDALIVRKALSGVARAKRRVGLMNVAKMLEGAEDPMLKRHGLDRLSTFGLFEGKERTWVVGLLRRLISAGLVDVTADNYPMPYLSRAGVAVMKGDEPVRVLPPDEAPSAPSPGKTGSARASKTRREPPPNMDDALFERLRAARLTLAQEKGVPAYVICHDRTLMEIAAGKPMDRQTLAQVPGMGPARLHAYGDRFLAVVSAS